MSLSCKFKQHLHDLGYFFPVHNLKLVAAEQ